MHDIVSDLADLFEFIGKCLAVNLYCERRPLFRIFQQTHVLTKRQIRNVLNFAARIRGVSNGGQLRFRELIGDQVPNMIFDLPQEEKKVRQAVQIADSDPRS